MRCNSSYAAPIPAQVVTILSIHCNSHQVSLSLEYAVDSVSLERSFNGNAKNPAQVAAGLSSHCEAHKKVPSPTLVAASLSSHDSLF